MNYMLLICSDGIPTAEKSAVVGNGIEAWLDETTARGVRKYGHPLAPVTSAKTVRRRDGRTLVSDGPFTESKEFVAGFDLIDAADLDEAIEIAAKHPVARFHAVEVRPFAQLPTASEELPSCGVPGVLPAAERLENVPPGRSRFMLFPCVDGNPASDAEEAQIVRDAVAWGDDLRAREIQIFGQALAHADIATTVRVRNGETLLSDGPFVEAKEFIAGICILDCESEQEAIELAAEHPLAAYHRVEVRAFASDSDD